MPLDRVTNALLEEFSRANQLDALPEETRFEHFAAYLAVSRHLPETIDTADLSTGSGGDTGIDAIAIIVNGTLVTDSDIVSELADTNGYLDVTFVFVQAERSSNFEATKIGNFGFGVMDFFKEHPTLPRNEAVSDAAHVMSSVYKLSPKFTRGNPICRLYYVTTGKWTDDPNLLARQRTLTDDLSNLQLFRDVEFIDLDANAIQRIYNQTKNAISRDFTFAARTVVPDMPGVTEAYLGLLPAPGRLRLEVVCLKGFTLIRTRIIGHFGPVRSRKSLICMRFRSCNRPVASPRVSVTNSGRGWKFIEEHFLRKCSRLARI